MESHHCLMMWCSMISIQGIFNIPNIIIISVAMVHLIYLVQM